MRKKSTFVVVAAIGFGLAGCDQVTEPAVDGPAESPSFSTAPAAGASAYSDLMGPQGIDTSNLPTRAASVAQAVSVTGEGLSVTIDQADFMTAQAGTNLIVRSETFDNSYAFIEACPGPFDSNTNDACYQPGAIVEGISVDHREDGFDPFGAVVLRGDSFGFDSSVVGANVFVDDTIIEFGRGVGIAGFELFDLFFGPCFVQLDISGPSGYIGSAIVPTGAGTSPVYVTITSVIPMDEIVIRDEISIFCGELVDNVFGGV